MKAFYQLLVIIGLSALVFTACDKDDDFEYVSGYLDNFTEITSTKSFKAADVKNYLEQDGQSQLASIANHDIKVFKLTYKTAFEGDSIIASGLVAVPIAKSKNETFPIMSYQHGVILSKKDAPTVNPQASVTELATFIASTGIIVLIPDYIGYGSSDKYYHPFMHKEYATNAVLDFVRASKEFIGTHKPCNCNGKLFLSGYGEGASATLAALSAIENDSVINSDLEVKASVCAAGTYNLIGFREWLVDQIKFDQPWYLAYLLESYNEYEGLTSDYSLVFSEPFASMIPGMVDGTKTGDQMNAMFGTKHLGELLNDNFENNTVFNTDTITYGGLKEILENNSIPVWNLKSNLNIYYGRSDFWIPADQSIYLFNDFRHLNVTTNLKITALDELDHETAVIPSLVKSAIWFKSF